MGDIEGGWAEADTLGGVVAEAPHLLPAAAKANGADIAHLLPFVISVTPKVAGARAYRVLVNFGPHTYSRELTADDDKALRVVDGSDERCFCLVRHGLSKNLPAIVKAAVGGRAFFSTVDHTYLLVENLPGCKGPYAVYFKLRKAVSKGIDVAMFVVSAYEKPNLPKTKLKITFATLVANVAQGKKIKRPKK